MAKTHQNEYGIPPNMPSQLFTKQTCQYVFHSKITFETYYKQTRFYL